MSSHFDLTVTTNPPLYVLGAPITLIPFTRQSQRFFPFACNALYICTQPRFHSAFSFLALSSACSLSRLLIFPQSINTEHIRASHRLAETT